MAKKLILEVKNLVKIFNDGKIANESINFQVFEGECIGLIGGNGAGKTTLVEQIAGLIEPTYGSIKFYFDYEYTPKEKIGIQFQNSSYPQGLTTKDIIQLQLDMYQTKITYGELNKLLDVFQVKDFYFKKVSSLSGGQLQKINVLLALIHSPRFVILDELTTALDVFAREEIFNYVYKFIKEKNITTILISHNMNEIEKLCTKVIVLLYGQIAYEGKISDIIKKYKTLDDYMLKIISDSEKIENIKRENADVLKEVNKKLTKVVKQKLYIKNLEFPVAWNEGDIISEKDLKVYKFKPFELEKDEKIKYQIYKVWEGYGEILVKIIVNKKDLPEVSKILKIGQFKTKALLFCNQIDKQFWNARKKPIPNNWKNEYKLKLDDLAEYGYKQIDLPDHNLDIECEIFRINQK
ncbi:MAG: ABC transporter ATP-binding protein, partial [Mycoplasma sp.]|nr:ABC transporter ATP-binding protein [Mycoplasma sp.]